MLFMIVLMSLVLAAVIAIFLLTASSTDASTTPSAEAEIGPAWLRRIVPRDAGGSLTAAVLMSALMGALAVLIGVYYIRQYGWAMFVAAPFAMGFAAGLLVSLHRQQRLPRVMLAGSLSVVAAAAAFLSLGLEGLICIAMSVPLALPAAIVGAVGSFIVQRRRREAAPGALGMIVVALPLTVLVEPLLVSGAPQHIVRSSVEIAAAPDVVWRHLVRFEPIAAKPHEWLFRAGVGYPISATIDSEGVGAVRVCEFSTGTFVETIRAWDKDRLLAFSVDRQPPVLRELTPYDDVHPPHLDHYFAPESAEFRLGVLPGGGTRLEGTSVYRNRMWPSMYWRVWSDTIVKRIHARVFQHVKQLAEGEHDKPDSAGLR